MSLLSLIRRFALESFLSPSPVKFEHKAKAHRAEVEVGYVCTSHGECGGFHNAAASCVITFILIRKEKKKPEHILDFVTPALFT